MPWLRGVVNGLMRYKIGTTVVDPMANMEEIKIDIKLNPAIQPHAIFLWLNEKFKRHLTYLKPGKTLSYEEKEANVRYSMEGISFYAEILRAIYNNIDHWDWDTLQRNCINYWSSEPSDKDCTHR